MATPYSDVIDNFLIKILDYDLPRFDDTQKEELLIMIMKSACAKFEACVIDLNNVNEVSKQFNDTLSLNIVDIITEGMIVEWIKPKVFNTEILKNSLNTKDFSLYSPANLLKEMRTTLELCTNNYRGMINSYSFKMADFKELGGN